jgi:N-acetyl-alpha-D-glucosaminyl L-malate synthase BshA
MKIVIFIISFPPETVGGAELSASKIAEKLSSRGHEVHIITTSLIKNENNYNNLYYIHRLKVFNIPIIRSVLYSLKSLFLVKCIKPDIIHGHTISILNAGFPAFLCNIFLKIPYILYGRGSDVYYSSNNPFEKKITKEILYRSSSIIVLTNHMKDYIEKIITKPIYVIPNGIDLKRYENLIKGNKYNKNYNKNNKRKIIFVGRLHQIKGVEYLIKSMAEIKEKFFNCELIIVGDGPEKKKLEKLTNIHNLNNHVRFVGRKSNMDAIKLISDSDIFVLPSLSEGFPLAILESMICGVPIIASNVTGINEIIKDGINGLLCEPKNNFDLSKKILILLKNEELCKFYSAKNKEKVKNYEWKDIIKKIEEIYSRSLMKKN